MYVSIIYYIYIHISYILYIYIYIYIHINHESEKTFLLKSFQCKSSTVNIYNITVNI